MGRNGKKASKNDDKNGTQASEADKAPDVSQKLDRFLEAVKNMGDQL